MHMVKVEDAAGEAKDIIFMHMTKAVDVAWAKVTVFMITIKIVDDV